MDTLTKTNDFLQLLGDHIGIQRKQQFEFGFKAISIQPLMSLNANARTTIVNSNTAEMKMYRILHNKHFLKELPLLITFLDFVKENDLINVDFSDFGDDRQVLMCSRQTRKGRAIPIYFRELQYPIKKGSQNLFIVEAILALQELLGFKIRLVFDRGFACPYIVEKLEENGIIFYVRIKKGKHVVLPNQRKLASGNVYYKDQGVFVYSNDFRLIRSEKPVNDNQAWYIVTNDKDSTREEIIKIYYHRFEIEELFRDAKHIFRMEYVSLKRSMSFQIVLWFVIVGIWLSWYLHQTLGGSKRMVRQRKDGKWPMSIIRYWFEQVQLQLRLYFLNIFSVKMCR